VTTTLGEFKTDLLPKTLPYDELCGCGIGFKLIQVCGNQNQTTEDLIPYLDLVSVDCC
jgi:single-stranded DNA-specific DHH superfamily exonuclease